MTVAIAASTIVQQAFRFMEMRSPASFADDSEQATAAAEQYDIALEMCLAFTDWSFASTVANLSNVVPNGIPVDPRMPFLFVLPEDMVMLREVIDPAGAYRADKGYLRSQVTGPLTIRYTSTITNEKHLPATFRTAVALQLAILLGPVYVEVQSKMDRLTSALTDALKLAARHDARTASPASWTSERDAGDWATGATW
jgi:hypothetical protein